MNDDAFEGLMKAQISLNKINDTIITTLKARIELQDKILKNQTTIISLLEDQLNNKNEEIHKEKQRAFDEGYSACEDDFKNGGSVNYKISDLS